MGNCNSFCRKTDALDQIQPDTQSMISRNAERGTDQAIARDGPPIPTERSHIQTEGEICEEIHKAVKEGDENMIAYNLEENPTLNLLDKKHQNLTPICTAIRYKQYKMLKYLLEQGANVCDNILPISTKHSDLMTVCVPKRVQHLLREVDIISTAIQMHILMVNIHSIPVNLLVLVYIKRHQIQDI